MEKDIFQKRCDLIIDYISQILVYGNNTNGTISINKKEFDDGKYLILTVNVLKNSYFRWHDLGIKTYDSMSLYEMVLKNILDKFKEFTITFSDNLVSISSSVNHNQIDIYFTLTTKKEKEWFLKQKDLFYNKNK
jgi:hypothetical protein